MALFRDENRYDAEVQAATAVFTTVPPAIVKAVMGAESAFNPNAVRGEPQLGDASYGLMQLLERTAKSMGYTGPVTGLTHPMTSVYYGTKLLADLYSKLKNWPDAISAYNGGIRPALGFGAKATKSLRVCLAWKAPNVCEKWQTVLPGQYANQAYVEKVLRYRDYFTPRPLTLPKPGERGPAPRLPTEGGATPLLVLLIGLGVAFAVGLRRLGL